jgi:hypothetical protein
MKKKTVFVKNTGETRKKTHLQNNSILSNKDPHIRVSDLIKAHPKLLFSVSSLAFRAPEI